MNRLIFILTLLLIGVFSSAMIHAAAVPAGVIPAAPAGVVSSDDGTPAAGVVGVDNGMEPDANPLAPNLPTGNDIYYVPDGPAVNNVRAPANAPTNSPVNAPAVAPVQQTTPANLNPNTAPPSYDYPVPTAPSTPVMESAPTSTPPMPELPALPARKVINNPNSKPGMEQCSVVDNDGNGLIKAYMADSGPSLEGDATAWIWVPVGQCTKINHGDFSGVSAAIRNKINPSDIQNAQTLD